jgi:hypothetical protein
MTTSCGEIAEVIMLCCTMIIDAGFTLLPFHSTYVLLICIFPMLLEETFSFSLNFLIFMEGARHSLQGTVCNIISVLSIRHRQPMVKL